VNSTAKEISLTNLYNGSFVRSNGDSSSVPDEEISKKQNLRYINKEELSQFNGRCVD
jgi:hypothetical protein